MPFVLYSQPTGVFQTAGTNFTHMSEEAHRRYAEIMRDVEFMLDDHSKYLSVRGLSCEVGHSIAHC